MDSSKKNWMSRIGIVVIAALMVEAISVVQYHRLRKILDEEMGVRTQVIMSTLTHQIRHSLERTEATMRENLWDVKQSMAHPDSVFPAMIRLIDDNPNVLGGCLAFSPYYYPSKGRLFEPYSSRNEDGTIEASQIAGPDHDYTQNEEYLWVVEHRCPSWTDPYKYGPDSLSLATYSYPILGSDGRVVAVCGLDIDLSWLGDTLNARQPYPSSFGLLLTEEGDLVAGPMESRTPRADVQQVLDIVNGNLPASANPRISIHKSRLDEDPYWQLIQVYRTDETFAQVRRLRRQQMLLILLGLAILAFMINSYARNEKKLRLASEERARMSGELEVGHRIQQEMLPKNFPSFVYGTLDPAREVGGDLFDFIMRDGKIFFCIGDVSGKGVPAAMLMSMVHSMFRMLSRRVESPSAILYSINEELSSGNDSNMFVTFFVGCLDLYSGVLKFANAGHDKPFVLSDEIALLPTKANLPLGVFPQTRFEEQTLTLEPGTTLLLYTDGLTETKNLKRQQFGRSGVQEVLRSCLAEGKVSPVQLVSALCDAADSFEGEAPQSDDLTLLVVRFAPENLLREQLTLNNDKAEVSRLSEFVKEYLGKLPIEKKVAAGLRLALEESVVNVICYAYPAGESGTVQIFADSNYEEVRFTIIDSGFPFDPTTVLEADTTLDAQSRPIGGLGILLTRKLVDSISYTRQEGKNVLSLTKSIL
jgi:serine phosphatase RsbU (regulator of sigma subunit)/anti-sigma regulatory factor (Ser/Thr protein kinase)